MIPLHFSTDNTEETLLYIPLDQVSNTRRTTYDIFYNSTFLLGRNSKDVVTAVTHHDINGMNTVSTVAVKDVDVQMTSLSGYETYV